MLPKQESLGRSYFRYRTNFLHQFLIGPHLIQFIVWFKPPLGSDPVREWFLYNYETSKLLAKGKVSWKLGNVKVEWGKLPKSLTIKIYRASLEMWYPQRKLT